MRLLFLLVFSLLFINPQLALSAESDMYDFTWLDKDKEVYVLQNRTFRKVDRFYINAGVGITTSGPFIDSTNYQGRVGYFFTEELGFQFLYSKNNGDENTTAAAVRNKGGSGTIPFRRVVDSYMGGMFMWSPFYSKVNTFNSILYMDWIVGVGVAKLDEVNNREEFLQTPGFVDKKESHTGIIWQVQSKMYLTPEWNFNIDMTTVHYRAPMVTQDKDTWYSNFDLTFSVAYVF